MKTILQALEELDPDNDQHWTSPPEELPLMEAIFQSMGRRDITRREVNEAAPMFTRARAREARIRENQSREVRGEPRVEEVPSPRAVARFDDIDPASPGVSDSIVNGSMEEMGASLETIERACAEFERQAVVLARRKSKIEEKLREIGKKSEALQRRRALLVRAGQKPDDGLQDYLRTQFETKLAKAERARAFVDAGTTPQDVREALNVRSKLDQHLMGRKRQVQGA